MQSSILWRVRLFDGPTLEEANGTTQRRFRSRKVGTLLAYLALKVGQQCSREELCCALWPEENERPAVANRLRVALASLRRQLEPPGIPFGSVLDVSNTGRICLRREAVWCDTVALEHALKERRFDDITALLVGSFLPGCLDEWAVLERQRFEAMTDGLMETIGPGSPEPAVRDSALNPQQTETSCLPNYLTKLFGRESEIARLRRTLTNHRLVTIIGHGGMGKTRLAIESVRAWKDPVVFVPLADTREESRVSEAVLRALRIAPSATLSPSEQLTLVLRNRGALLLLLDNAEHVIDGVASLALSLLETLPQLAVLATSRQSLNIVGEALVPLTPISTPSLETPAETLARNPAVALFLDRARLARPDFALSAHHIDPIRRICQLLEGVPLALELAAARIVLQSPAQIAGSLESGMMLLASRQHGFSIRHRSLRASLQGSFELLEPEVGRFFAQLSVFRGGWTPCAAREMTGEKLADDFLETLARHSLVSIQENESTGEIRCAFLESVRQFAGELLSDSDRHGLLESHANYFLELAGGVSEDDFESFQPLEPERENLLVALETGANRPDAQFWRGLNGILVHAHLYGQNRSLLPWAERATEIDALEDVAMLTRLQFTSYRILSYMGRLEDCRALGERMLRRAEASDDGFSRVHAKLALAFVASQAGEFEHGLNLSQSALSEARQRNDDTLLARCLRLRSWLLVTYALGATIPNDGDRVAILAESEILARECLDRLPSRSSHRSNLELTLAYALGNQGRADEAYTALKRAQKTALDHGVQTMLIFSFMEECHYALDREEYERAALLYGGYLALREKTGYDPVQERSARNERPPRLMTERLGSTQFEEWVARGRQTPPIELASHSLFESP